MIEYGAFRKNGNGYDAPLENRTYASRALAQAAIERTYTDDFAEWLEIRSRAVTTWLREEDEL